MIVRKMTSADVARVTSLEGEIFSDPWCACSVSNMTETPIGIALVLEDEGQIVGYLLGQAIPPEGELFRIATDKAHRRHGYGKALMTAFIEELEKRGTSDLYLEVRRKNAPAISLYSAFGFSECAVRKDYYKNPTDDASVMVAHLSETER